MSSDVRHPPANDRYADRQRFLDRAGLAGADIVALAPDASFRRYFRVVAGDSTLMMMDAPPPRENVAPFIRVDEHLRRLGLSAPTIIDRDERSGFLLLEDFGDDTFTQLLARGHDAAALYRLAVDTLLALQAHPRATDIDLPPYDLDALLDEAMLLPDWHLRLTRDKAAHDDARNAWRDAWRDVLCALPPPALSLVLRDFHVDNLMLLHNGDRQACGLLDFQDALIGPAAYDLASLLQDARRDIDPAFEAEFVEYFLAGQPLLDRENFMAWYTVLAAQRHAKVIGIFSRLCLRDGKGGYLRHLPRVIRLLERTLAMPTLEPVGDWLNRHLPERLDYQPKQT